MFISIIQNDVASFSFGNIRASNWATEMVNKDGMLENSIDNELKCQLQNEDPAHRLIFRTSVPQAFTLLVLLSTNWTMKFLRDLYDP